jgi:GxxExxY protein
MAAVRDPVVEATIGAAIEVHRALGPGLLESAYRRCLVFELMERGLTVASEVPVPVVYKGHRIDCGYRADLIVDGDVLVEVKAVEALTPVHTAQVITYLKLTGARQVLLMNFHALSLRAGLKSFLPGVGNSRAGQEQANHEGP